MFTNTKLAVSINSLKDSIYSNQLGNNWECNCGCKMDYLQRHGLFGLYTIVDLHKFACSLRTIFKQMKVLQATVQTIVLNCITKSWDLTDTTSLRRWLKVSLKVFNQGTRTLFAFKLYKTYKCNLEKLIYNCLLNQSDVAHANQYPWEMRKESFCV